jgi:hypothetical protein
MASTLKAVRFTNSSTSFQTAYTALGTSPSTSPATHKSTLLTGLRVVNSDSSNIDHTYSVQIVDSSGTVYLLMNDDVIQAKAGRDLAPGGTTMVLNQGDIIKLKADANSSVTLHIDVIERDA